MKNTLYNKGFTLVEIAVVMVIVGLLVGLGSAMIGPMMSMSKSRETKEFLGGAVESVNSWAASNNRLPDVTTAVNSPTLFSNVAKTPLDAWGRNLIYLYDCRFASTDPIACPGASTAFSKDTICGRRTTQLTVQTIDPAATIQNVAFVVMSQGDDPQVAAPSIFTTFDTAVTGPAVTVNTPLAAPRTIFVNAGTDDIVRWVTLDELRSKIGCQGAQLKILNNELPYLVSGSDTAAAYNATVTADGGVLSSGYRWCVQNTTGTAITGLTFTPNIFSADCTALRQTNETNWLSGSSLTITRTPVNPPYQAIAPNSYSFTIYVSDNSDTGTNDNITSKSFVLTVSP